MDNIINTYNPQVNDIINDPNKKEFINQYVNKIYIINLLSDKLRMSYIILLMKKFNINYTLVQVEKPSQLIYNLIIRLPNKNIRPLRLGEVGCYLSHMWCLNDIIKNNYTNAIIFEDDIIIHKNYDNLLKKILINSSYDFLMLGAADHGFNKGNSLLVKNNIYIPKNYVTLGTHSIYYSNNGAQKIFDYRSKYPTFFDNNLNELFTFFESEKTGICYPNLFTVENSTTNIGHHFGITKYELNDYYYNECYENFDFNDYHFIYLDLFNKFMLEDITTYTNIKTPELLINELLANYFNNNIELIQHHYKKLSVNLFTFDEYCYLLETSKNKITQLYYSDFKRYCEIENITHGTLLIKNIPRYQIIQTLSKYNKNCTSNTDEPNTSLPKNCLLFYKHILDPSIKEDKMTYDIIYQFDSNKEFAAHLHCYNINLFDEYYKGYIDKISNYMDIIVTFCVGDITHYIDNISKTYNITLIKIVNKGMDIGAKFCAMNHINSLSVNYKYILFLHSKTCKKTRAIYFDSLINNLEQIILQCKDEKIGGFFPPTIHLGNDNYIVYGNKAINLEIIKEQLYELPSNNYFYVNLLLQYFDVGSLNNNNETITLFPSGNCFMINMKIAKLLYGDLQIYNLLNNQTGTDAQCFDYNWVKLVNNVPYQDINFVFLMYQKFKLKGNLTQCDYDTIRDGHIEHAFERIVFQSIKKFQMDIHICKLDSKESNLVGSQGSLNSKESNLVGLQGSLTHKNELDTYTELITKLNIYINFYYK
jgi:GR25 family glycosyltransferase involved in LPS biosynthesis